MHGGRSHCVAAAGASRQRRHCHLATESGWPPRTIVVLIDRGVEGLVCVNTVSSKNGTLLARSGARSLVGLSSCDAATIHTREAQQQHHLSTPYISSLRPSYYASVKEGLKAYESKEGAPHSFLASRLHDASPITIRPTFMIEEHVVVGAVLLLSAVAGLIPATEAYPQDVATTLAPAEDSSVRRTRSTGPHGHSARGQNL
jgi:hypothetical protein